ncbi:Uncharacterized alpha/beta hydrolase domain [Geodermatophilus saharensis]|uniref:Uncharacterized alpha/beta hydrolase domain n=1 Tax=Geodermatophilus saharensis TaxID=1137994 RepID=A0A239C3F6_9ACTN|nr:DUF2235 domain-containing protein [Geodermatophilus saharensis]SNS14161.1 Uncharacterized alpha/beta hydrolase domain [Geodermatophilus saharensis]
MSSIPAGPGRSLTRRSYGFHDTDLSGLVDVACHAVAVDEHRGQFEPTLWTDVPRPVPGHRAEVEQRWFVGAHGDVGGGSGTTEPATPNPLSLLAVARRSRLTRPPPARARRPCGRLPEVLP